MFDNDTSPIFRGLCPAPFLDVSAFPLKGGYIPGRVCSKVYQGLTCCLPCPATDWIYPQSFMAWYKVAQGLSAVGFAICIFLVLSWVILPTERAKSHYLGICLAIGIMLVSLAFVIPLGVPHNPCFNEITPNDMTSNLTCAFSGASLVLGGLIIAAWIAIRSLSMHLQICWDVIPGTKFFYLANGLGWGFPIVIFIISMCLTGVSYRFGDTCHLNAKNSMGAFWVPMLIAAGLAAILQFGTLLYCVRIYFKSIWSTGLGNEQSYGSSTLPSYAGSSRARSARALYQRVKKILWLQWRSVTIVLVLLADVIFFAIVWIELDVAVTSIENGNTDHIMGFLACILVNPSISARPKCFSLGQKVMVSERTCIALLLMLSLTGIQTGIILTRFDLFRAWGDYLPGRWRRNKEFVSLDAKRYSVDPRATPIAVPMNPMQSPKPVESVHTVETVGSIKELTNSPLAGQVSSFDMERNYRQPRMSFSTPRPAMSPPPPPSPYHNRSPREVNEIYTPDLNQTGSYSPTQPRF